MRVTRSKRWVRRHQIRFEGISETATSSTASSPVFLCPRTRTRRRLEQCLRCNDFVNVRPVPEHGKMLLRCLCTDEDPLARCAPTHAAWPTVRPETSLKIARRLARVRNVPALLVARDDQLCGMVYREQLEAPGSTVSTRMVEYPWALSTRATLGDAVEALCALAVPALLVVAPDAELIAVISAASLTRLGVPGELLDHSPAAE